MFLNVSHHPSSFWSDSQRQAAEALGGRVADFPFPDVPPEASSEDIRRIARELLRQIVQQQPVAVMVEGEFTLAFRIVSALIANGIRCYAATTRRVVDERQQADSTSRLSVFEFVRFREYLR